MIVQRIAKADDIATIFSKSKGWFYAHRKRLEQLEFPKRDAELGGWDIMAITAWFDSRSNILKTDNIEQQMLEAINGQHHA